jgi:hypothetical protein
LLAYGLPCPALAAGVARTAKGEFVALPADERQTNRTDVVSSWRGLAHPKLSDRLYFLVKA